MVVMASALMFKLLNATYDAIQLDANANDGVAAMKTIGPLVIYGIICLFIILSMPTLAGSIGGAFALANASALGWSYDKIQRATSSGLRFGKRGAQAGYQGLRTATRHLGRTSPGGTITGSRASTPKAIYRKITSQSRRTQAV
jgi:type IV secretion system protein VirB6